MSLAKGKRTSRILIADNHLLFRRGLRTVLSAEPDMEVLEEAGDVPEAAAKVRLLTPDILIMDLALVQEGGEQAALSIRQACEPHTAILFLTNEDSPQQLELAVAAGARGYMLKDSPPAQLTAGVRQVVFVDEQGQGGLSKIVPDLRALASSNNKYPSAAALTSREEEVMRLLAEGRTVREVAAELALSVKTIEAHKLNLMRKLDIHNRASLIEHAIQRGMIQQQVTT